MDTKKIRRIANNVSERSTQYSGESRHRADLNAAVWLGTAAICERLDRLIELLERSPESPADEPVE